MYMIIYKRNSRFAMDYN